MSYDDFIAELGKAGLSVRSFADLLGMRPNSISNNKKNGEVPGHLAAIAALLAELRLHGISSAPVFARIGTIRKKPRGGAAPGRFGTDKQGILELGP
jgi:hypothetical protein